APCPARTRSCVRRASDSIIRSSTASFTHLCATTGVIVGSKAATLSGMVTVGTGGRIQTLPVAWAGAVPLGGGRAVEAAPTAHDPRAGPSPTARLSFGVEPAGRPGAG